jgi:hypothetical protein
MKRKNHSNDDNQQQQHPHKRTRLNACILLPTDVMKYIFSFINYTITNDLDIFENMYGRVHDGEIHALYRTVTLSFLSLEQYQISTIGYLKHVESIRFERSTLISVYLTSYLLKHLNRIAPQCTQLYFPLGCYMYERTYETLACHRDKIIETTIDENGLILFPLTNTRRLNISYMKVTETELTQILSEYIHPSCHTLVIENIIVKKEENNKRSSTLSLSGLKGNTQLLHIEVNTDLILSDVTCLNPELLSFRGNLSAKTAKTILETYRSLRVIQLASLDSELVQLLLNRSSTTTTTTTSSTLMIELVIHKLNVNTMTKFIHKYRSVLDIVIVKLESDVTITPDLKEHMCVQVETL